MRQHRRRAVVGGVIAHALAPPLCVKSCEDRLLDSDVPGYAQDEAERANENDDREEDALRDVDAVRVPVDLLELVGREDRQCVTGVAHELENLAGNVAPGVVRPGEEPVRADLRDRHC